MGYDYNSLIENLKKRRYDETLRKPVMLEHFESVDYPDCVRYTLEVMQEIDTSYAYKVYYNAQRIHKKISQGLTERNIGVEYRYQGVLKTSTNILLYGNVEIIVLKKNPSEMPHRDVQLLGNELINILSGDTRFKSIDYSNKTRIHVTTLELGYRVDLLPSIWKDTLEYQQTGKEIYRAIAEFDFTSKKIKKYMPFLNIARINAKDRRLNGNLKALVRLLLTLQEESEEPINLGHTEINALLYAMPEDQLKVDNDHILSLLPGVEEHLKRLTTDDDFFKSLVSPSQKERIFTNHPEKKQELIKLHNMLSTLLNDIKTTLDEKDLTLEDRIAYKTV